jgi:hypothetical protein
MGEPDPGNQDRTNRSGQPERERQNKMAGIGHFEQDNYDGLTSQYMETWIAQPEEDKTDRPRQPEQR